MKKSLLVLFIFTILSSSFVKAQFYAGSNQQFGKNRIQYREFNWLYLPYDRFEVYYYQGGKELAKYTLESAFSNLKEIEELFDYALDDKIQIIVYNKQSEFRQSNIGIMDDDQYNIGGSARIMGSKVFLYFDGDFEHFEEQLRSSLAEILLNQMMYGGDWKEVIKNSTLLTLPSWYLKGAVSYASKEWDYEKAAYIQDGVESGIYSKFNRLEGDQATYGGHALWKYIADVYGANVIPNILYMCRVSRNVESGFLFVLGISLDEITAEFLEYYQKKFKSESLGKMMPEKDLVFEKSSDDYLNWANLSDDEKDAFLSKKGRKFMGELPVKFRKKYRYSQFHVSPDQQYVAYVTHEMGQYKIWLHDIQKNKTKRIYKREPRLARIEDRSFPILAWHPTSQVLTFAFEMQGRVYFGNYNTDTKKIEEKELFRLDKVIDMAYSDDGRKIILSGVKEGQSDLYLYQVIGNNQSQLTNDIYDDLNPSFIRNSSAVIFSSNRPDDTLRVDVPTHTFPIEKDIYIMELEGNNSILDRVTDTPDKDEHSPFEYDSKHYTYLTEDKGMVNRYIASIDSSISRIDTIVHYRFFTVSERASNFERPPLEYDFNAKSKSYSLLFLENNKFNFYLEDASTDQGFSTSSISNDSESEVPAENTAEVLIIEEDRSELEVDIENYRFEDDPLGYEYEKETITIGETKPDGTTTEPLTESDDFQYPKARNYRLNFATDYVLGQIDNTFANQFYQLYTGPTSVFPGISGLMKLGVSDLFEDYKIVGGYRMSSSLNNNDYGISFQNIKGRLDRKISFQRQSNRQIFSDPNSLVQSHTHLLDYELKYPINELLAVKTSVLYRLDRQTALATDPINIARPNNVSNNVGLKLELIFDNTLNKGLNLYNGTRYKLWAEYYQDPDVQSSDFKVLGFDFRHYERIHRDLIFAFRVAGSTSFGSRKLVYYLGGVDNWLGQRIDDSMPIATDQNYTYQALAAPLRGFFVNARNGNSFAVANAEVRWPIVKYFMNKPLKSDFLENFQIVAFADVGSAWTGPHPYSEENSFNQIVLEQNPITVTIDNNREPIVYGFGGGLRSRVLGYFLRADLAWGVDDNTLLPRQFYLSLSTDF